MKKHASNSKQKQSVAVVRTSGNSFHRRFKREILSFLAIAAVLIATVSLSSCAGVTSASAPGGNTSTPGTGILSPASSSLSFGNVTVGSSAMQTVNVTNTGTAVVDISQAAVTGTGFTIAAGNSPAVLAVGQSATMQVQFAPSAAGSASGSLSVMSNAPNTPLTIALAGVGMQGDLAASPLSVSFGSVLVGSNSAIPVTLSNTGTAAVSITAVSISGAGFTMSALAPQALNPGQTVSFTATYAPTSGGSASGTVSITSNAPGSPLRIALTGSGTPTAAQLSINPSALAFSGVAVGGNTTQNVTLTNTGNATLNITAAGISGAAYSMNLAAPVTINPGANTSFAVTFKPTAAGSVPGNITLTSNSSGSPTSIGLTGTGTQGSLGASPPSINFGNVIVGSNSAIPVTLSNSGTGAVSITAATISGTGFTMTTLSPQTLNPGQTTSFTAKYTPTTAGGAGGSVSITTNAVGSPLVIALTGSGTATAAQLSISPSALAFSGVAVGSNAAQTVTLSNTGNATLNITAASISGTGYTMNLGAPVTINAGANTTFQVTYTPTLEGSVAGSLSLTSNASGSPAAIGLTGTGLQAQASANPANASFGSVSVGNSNSQPVTLKNNGNATLTFSQISVTGAGFSVTGISTGTTIAAGASMTFNAIFTPTSGASSTGSVTLAMNGTPSQLAIGLTGTGAAATYSLSASATSLSFGTVQAGQSASLPTTLTNTGNTSVTISGVMVSGTGFSGSGISSGLILTPGQTATLTVQFAPTTTGVDSGSVSIASNASSSPTISLSGSSHAVALSWTASSGTVSGYNVYRGTVVGAYGSSPLNSSPVPSTAFSDATVSGGTTYYYVVRSIESGVESANSIDVQATVPSP